ncbi:MAG: autotransporter assembly complex family protein [Pseudomonadota bacterium]
MLLLAGALFLAACGEDDAFFEVEDDIEPIFYTVELQGVPSDTIQARAEAVLRVYRQQDEGAPSLGFLRRRAQNDTETLSTLLRSAGYVMPNISVSVADPTPGEARAQVILTIEAGRRFTLAEHAFVLTNATPMPGALDPAELGSPVNGPAVAEDIIAAEDAAVAQLRRTGYAYARFVQRDAVADPEAGTMRVESVIDAGRRYTFGALTFEGLEAVEEDYLRTYVQWGEGEVFNRALLPDLEEDFAGTSLFSRLSITTPDEPPEGEVLPVAARVEERLPRSITFGVRFDTDVGPGFVSSLQHRNLFGRNETGQVSGSVNREERTIGFDYRVPQFGRDGQDLVYSLDLTQFDQDAFEGNTVATQIGLERELDEDVTAGVGILIEYSDLIDSGVPQESTLFGLPVFLAFDSVRDPLDPQNGARSRIELTPFTGTVDEEPVEFLRVDGRLATYRKLDNAGRIVLATRVRAGAILTNDLTEVPSTKRLFAGGGGSVRGFASDSIGPRDANGDPRGGLSVVEAGVELRYRATETIGLAVFTEGGIVDDIPVPDVIGDVRQGVGAGVRFFTPIGPIRADLARPVQLRSGEDPYQLYLSLGQAF